MNKRVTEREREISSWTDNALTFLRFTLKKKLSHRSEQYSKYLRLYTLTRRPFLSYFPFFTFSIITPYSLKFTTASVDLSKHNKPQESLLIKAFMETVHTAAYWSLTFFFFPS